MGILDNLEAYLEKTEEQERPMCSNCTIHKDKAFYSKYENINALCDFCQTFQDSLFKAIDQEVGRIKTEPINLVN